MVRVEAVLDTWKTVREDAALAVEEFPAGDFGFKPTADVMSFGDIANHILQAGHALTGLLLDGVENFSTPEFRPSLKKYIDELPARETPAELAALLRSELAKRCEAFAAQPPEFFSAMITRMDGMPVTRLEMLQYIKEHELTHRSQLFLYLRLKGLVPATTRRRQAKAKA